MKNKILNWFEKFYPNIINDMKNTNHNHSNGSINPYHAEGDVWKHTLMVYDLIIDENVNTLFAALLHDLGKTHTRYEKNDGKVSFRNHENVSMYYSIDILKNAKKDFKDLDLLTTLKLIAWHGTLWNHLKNIDNEFLNNINLKYGNDIPFFKSLISFVEADYYGRLLLNNDECKEKNDIFNFLYNYIPFNKLQYKEKRNLDVVVLIGLSGSGKSTLIEKHYKDFEIISVDKFLEKGKLNYNMIDYNKNVIKAYNQSLLDMKEYINNKKNVVIDMTNLTIESRRKRLSNFPSTQYNKKAIVFLNGLNNLTLNLNKRKSFKNIDFDIIKNQISNFELPNFDEFDNIEYIF